LSPPRAGRGTPCPTISITRYQSDAGTLGALSGDWRSPARAGQPEYYIGARPVAWPSPKGIPGETQTVCDLMDSAQARTDRGCYAASQHVHPCQQEHDNSPSSAPQHPSASRLAHSVVGLRARSSSLTARLYARGGPAPAGPTEACRGGPVLSAAIARGKQCFGLPADAPVLWFRFHPIPPWLVASSPVFVTEVSLSSGSHYV
jgi:hypothetical protein